MRTKFSELTEQEMRDKMRWHVGYRNLVLLTTLTVYGPLLQGTDLEMLGACCWLGVVALQIPFESSLRRRSPFNYWLGIVANIAPLLAHICVLCMLFVNGISTKPYEYFHDVWFSIGFFSLAAWYCIVQPFLQLGMLRMVQQELGVVEEAARQHQRTSEPPDALLTPPPWLHPH